MSERPEQRDSERQFQDHLLVTVGALIVGVAGPCTLFFGGPSLYEWIDSGDRLARDIVELAALFGGLPLLIGIGLIIFGRKLRRQSAIKSNEPNERG